MKPASVNPWAWGLNRLPRPGPEQPSVRQLLPLAHASPTALPAVRQQTGLDNTPARQRMLYNRESRGASAGPVPGRCNPQTWIRITSRMSDRNRVGQGSGGCQRQEGGDGKVSVDGPTQGSGPERTIGRESARGAGVTTAGNPPACLPSIQPLHPTSAHQTEALAAIPDPPPREGLTPGAGGFRSHPRSGPLGHRIWTLGRCARAALLEERSHAVHR